MNPNITVVIRRRQPINISIHRRQAIQAIIRKHNINVSVVRNVIQVTAKLQGPAGPPGSGSGSWSSIVSPNQSPNGVRTVFTTPELFVAGTLRVMLNGLLEPVTEQTGGNFQFVDAPYSTDIIQLWYQRAL